MNLKLRNFYKKLTILIINEQTFVIQQSKEINQPSRWTS